MRIARIVLTVAGIAAMIYGVSTIANAPATLISVGVWMVAAVIIHDGLLSPLVLLVARGLSRLPAHGRRYLQVGLVLAGMVTVIAVPMIIEQGTFPPAKALLRQNYGLNLVVLLGLVGVGTLSAYAVSVARGGRDKVVGAEDESTS